MLNFLQARIDHKNGTVHFGGLKAESDQLRDHLANLAQRLTKACTLIQPAVNSTLEDKRLQVRLLVLDRCQPCIVDGVPHEMFPGIKTRSM